MNPDYSDPVPEQIGPYKLLRALGKGGMGVVYEGVDIRLDRRVAVKTARMDRIDPTDHEARERFLREARAAAALNHPGIITIYEADEWEGGLYIAMEFIEGTDLSGWVRRNGLPPVHQAVEWLATLAETLAYAHRRGVVHRDIKPANILVSNEGHLKITDFGIARLESSTLTQEGAILGTPNYMSPEQFIGRKADGRADLFSLAVVGYELLTGTRPFTGDSFSAIMYHVLHTPPVPPDMLNPEISPALRDVILKALNKSPAERYQDGDILAKALRNAVSEDAKRIHDMPTVVASSNQTTVKSSGSSTVKIDSVTAEHDSEAETHLEKPASDAAQQEKGEKTGLFSEIVEETAAPKRIIKPKGARRLLYVAAVLLAGLFVLLFFVNWQELSPQTDTPGEIISPPQQDIDLNPVVPVELKAVDASSQAGGQNPATVSSSAPSVRLAYYLYITQSPDVYRAFPSDPSQQGEFLKSKVPTGEVALWKNSNAVIIVRDTSPGNSVPLVNEPVPESGRGIISVPQDAASLRFEIRDATGLTLSEAEYKDNSWDSARYFLVLQ